MKRIPVFALLTTATLSLLVSGATVRIAAAGKKALREAPRVIVLRAARMPDVQTGRMISPAVVVIEKDRITSVPMKCFLYGPRDAGR